MPIQLFAVQSINVKMCRIIFTVLLVVCVIIIFLLLSKKAQKDEQKKFEPPTIRQTSHGPVEGIEETTVLGQKYYAFRGIPYAAPPITGIDPYSGKMVDRRFKVA